MVKLVTYKMWKKVMQGLYDSLKIQVKDINYKVAWIEFMKDTKHPLIRSVNRSVMKIELFNYTFHLDYNIK